MTNVFQRLAWRRWAAGCALALVLGVAGTAQAQSLAQRIGWGNGYGYNGPVPEKSGLFCGTGLCADGQCGFGFYGGAGCLQPGCCDIPGHWRTHIWDDYPNEPLAQRWGGGRLKPVAQVPPPARTIFHRGGTTGASCPNCQPAPAMTTQPLEYAPVLATPPTAPQLDDMQAKKTIPGPTSVPQPTATIRAVRPGATANRSGDRAI